MKRKIIIALLSLWLGGQFSQAIRVRFPNLTGVVGDTITVPLYVDDDVTGNNIKAFQFDIGYSNSNVKFLGVNTTGTISSVFSELVVKNKIDYFTIVGAGSSSLEGSGVLLNVKLLLIGYGSSLNFRNTNSSNFFNEGTPALTFTNGYISITAKPVINVSPANVILNIGELQQFSSWGGTAPYIWSVSDNSIASIAADGKLTVLTSGIVKVISTDSKGYSGTSGNIDCRSFNATLRDTTFYQNNFIEIPLYFKNLDATPMYSGKFVFSFSESVISFDSFVTAGTILAGVANLEFSKLSGKAVVTFAFPTGNTDSGILFKLRFKIADTNYGGSYINIEEATINESLYPKSRNGYFSIKTLPTLYISPGSAEMFAGENKQFSVSGGTVPYTWEVENPALAITTGTGYLTAISGGNTKLLVKDFNGAKTSCTINIYDTWVNVRDSAASVDHKVLNLPIDLGSIPLGKGIFALSGKVNSSFSKIDSIQVNTSGTLTESWQMAKLTGKNQSNFALSGTGAITNGGKMLNLKIYFNNSLVVGDAFYINCTELMLNEGTPNVKVKSGYISIKSIVTDIKEIQSSQMFVYPVPASDFLIINLDPEYNTSVISVLDLSGKMIFSTKLHNYNAKQFSLPVQSLSEGFYFLKLQSVCHNTVLKFSKH